MARALKVLGALLMPVGPALALSSCGISSSSTVRAVGPMYEVATARLGGLGSALVDGKGFTLYLFLPDHHSGHSRCFGLCAAAWPPLILPNNVPAPVAGKGVRSSLLGTTLRSDGSRQVTYNGWPLYLYTIDAGPGQVNGQGINNLGGLWYVVAPNGSPTR